MYKVNFKRTNFEENIRESFSMIRNEKRLFDVTLATDDGQYVQAHKVILSAGSNFFKDIFLKTNHTNMLIYLKGISTAELENVIDFLYNGETTVNHAELRGFIETGKDLQVNGIDDGELTGIGEELPKEEQNEMDVTVELSTDHTSNEALILNEVTSSPLTSLGRLDENIFESSSNGELESRIEELIEKYDGIWKCKICTKTATDKSHIREHAETHMTDISHTCHICSKTCPTKPGLRKHIYRTHSEKFTCNICGKSGMNRGTHIQHMYNIHSELVSCEICGKSGMNKSVYRHHMSYIHSEPFSCHICGKSEMNKSMFRRHIANHHSESS